jgi:ParB family chromosome partitioning protein
MEKKKALGKGIGALIPEKEKQGVILSVDIDHIKPSKFQPRKKFDPKRLEELVSSIKKKGIMQPIVVRHKKTKKDKETRLPLRGTSGQDFEVIAGERRLRALKKLNYEQAPVIIKDVKDEEALELSLIENIQREELNPIEEARAFKQLTNKHNLSQEDIAKAVGKDRSTVSNILRLLNLPEEIQEYVSREKLSMGQARAILSLEDESTQLLIAKEIMKKELSVRETERLIKRTLKGPKFKQKKIKDSYIKDMEEQLQRSLGTKVTIYQGKNKGKIQLEYYTPKDLERLIKKLK